jgi:hypothetical protein
VFALEGVHQVVGDCAIDHVDLADRLDVRHVFDHDVPDEHVGLVALNELANGTDPPRYADWRYFASSTTTRTALRSRSLVTVPSGSVLASSTTRPPRRLRRRAATDAGS